MTRRRALTLAGAAAALAGSAAVWHWMKPGDPPLVPAHWPELPVHSLGGQLQALAAQSPRLRLINLWARWCAPCRRELPSLQRLAGRLDAQRFEVLALALEDDPFALREYVAAQRLALPVWRLAPAESARLQGSATLPQTWLVAPDGRVLARWPGERDWDRPELHARVLALADGAGPW